MKRTLFYSALAAGLLGFSMTASADFSGYYAPAQWPVGHAPDKLTDFSAPVPEPTSVAMMALGVAGMAGADGGTPASAALTHSQALRLPGLHGLCGYAAVRVTLADLLVIGSAAPSSTIGESNFSQIGASA